MDALIAFVASMFAWQNVLFTTTLGLGTLLVAAQALAGAHSDHDHDGAIDHDADGDLAVHGHAGGALVASALAGLGLGRVPLSLLLPIGLVSFGMTGLAASLALGGLGARAGAFSELLELPVLGAAFAGALLGLRASARLFARFAPDVRTASGRAELVGLPGVVLTAKVDAEFGMVRVKDAFGHELEVPCVGPVDGREVREGDEVVLTAWDPERNRFRVVPFVDAPERVLSVQERPAAEASATLGERAADGSAARGARVPEGREP